MSQDIAKLAYETWAYYVTKADDEDPVPWEDLTEAQTSPWVAVESRFIELRDGDLDAGPESIDFELAFPPPDVDAKGRPMSGTKHRKRAVKFSIRRPVASDTISVQEYPLEERDLRLAYACMRPVPSSARFDWGKMMDFELADLLEIKTLVLDGWRSLDGQLYDVWRGPYETVVDLEMVDRLHPDDAPAFTDFERDNKNRGEVLAALERRALEEPGDAERWEGEVSFVRAVTWTELVRSDSNIKQAWFFVALKLARATEDESIHLFTPSARARTLKPKIERVRGRELLAMRRESTAEGKALVVAACLCDVAPTELEKLTHDDFMRVAWTTEKEWLPNRVREREGRPSGSVSERQTSPSSRPSTIPSLPSP